MVLIFRLGLLNAYHCMFTDTYIQIRCFHLCFACEMSFKVHFLSINKKGSCWFWNGILSFTLPASLLFSVTIEYRCFVLNFFILTAMTRMSPILMKSLKKCRAFYSTSKAMFLVTPYHIYCLDGQRAI